MNKLTTKLASRGSFSIGMAVGLTVAGFVLRDGVLITLGLSAFTLMLCCYILGRCNVSGLEVSLRMPERIHANKSYQPDLSLRNSRGLLDVFNVRLYIAFPHGALLESEAAWIPAQSSSAASIKLKVPMRAAGLVHPYKLCSFFPLGLFHFTHRNVLQQQLIVYPRPIIPAELLRDGALGNSEFPMQNSSLDHSGEPRGIRPWQPGDPAKGIHWPASVRSIAHGHGIRVREFDPPGQLPEVCSIIFHSFSGVREMMREDRYERAISLLLGTVNYLKNLNVKTTVIADFMGWHPYALDTRADYFELLAILAECQRSLATEQHELQGAIDSLSSDHAVILISDMPLSSWRNDIQLSATELAVDITQIKFPFKPTTSAKEALARSSQ